VITDNRSCNRDPARVRPIRLLQQDAKLGVAPPLEDPERFEPFRLPKLPLSLARWTNAFGYRVRRRRDVCVALILMLDCEQRQWVTPAVPTQECNHERVLWNLRASDYGDRRGAERIAGSFQTWAADAEPIDIADHLPAFDGLHLVDQYQGKELHRSWMFLRCAGENSLADPAEILVDELRSTLRRYSHRMTFT